VTDDPERLVAEALRAHAARTPLPEREQSDATGSLFGSYGLLSGGDASLPASLPAVDEPTIVAPVPADHTTRFEPESRVAVGWVILLAVLLGLAAGAVVGLLTLL
jgi:hypothetical protein